MIVVFEDEILAMLLAETISGNPNNLDCLTEENLAKVEILSSVTIERKAEDKIQSLRGLENCINLRQLHLIDHNIKEIGALYDINKLEIVNLRKNQIECIYPLVEKTTIKTLVLGQNNIKDVSILATLTGLERLYIQENPIENESLLFLNNLPSLQEVGLWETNELILDEVDQYKDHIKRVYTNKYAYGA